MAAQTHIQKFLPQVSVSGWETNPKELLGGCPICPVTLSSSFLRHPSLGGKRIQKNSAGWLFSCTLRCYLNKPIYGLKWCQFHTPKRWLVSRSITP